MIYFNVSEYERLKAIVKSGKASPDERRRYESLLALIMGRKEEGEKKSDVIKRLGSMLR